MAFAVSPAFWAFPYQYNSFHLTDMATRMLLIASVALIISGVSSENEKGPIPQQLKGAVQQLGGMNSYVSGSPTSKVSVILISDVFGFENPHLRMLADKLADARFYTVVPDFFNGDPYVSKSRFTPWLNKHRPEEGYNNALPVIEALKAKGIDAFGAAGICWGGKVAVDLLNHHYVRTVVLLHPTYTYVDDIEKVTAPIAIFGGENDKTVPVTLLKQFEAILKEKPEVTSFVQIYPKVDHGWTVSYNDTDQAAVRIAMRTHQDTRNWFVKHLILKA